MENYQDKQEQLISEIERSFQRGNRRSTIVESVSNYQNDIRMCLTGVVFIPDELGEIIISKIIEPLKKIDSSQYFYPVQSLHLTIQNIRTISNPPLFGEEEIEKAELVFQKVIPKHPSFTFFIKGLFELPTSLALKAYCDESLKFLVQDLRQELKDAGIPDNKTYASDEVFFGNITICRYTSPVNQLFLDKVKNLKDTVIGNLKIKNISLIKTNSVCHLNKTKIINKFDLNSTL